MSSTPSDASASAATISEARGGPLFSVIIPSAGLRPRGLAQAVASVDAAYALALGRGALGPGAVEILVGFDGRDGQRPQAGLADLRFFVLPRPQGATCGFGNHIRHILMGQARGRRLLLVDDDNALTPEALLHYLPHLDAEMVIARVDTSRAFDVPFLPRPAPEGADPAADAIRQGNIDPLCLCLSRELACVRCRGWLDEGGYESDFLNIRRYFRRARSVVRTDALVGVYDAGRGLDQGGLNSRQRKLASPGA
jgi:hypothetical protein